MLLVYLSGTHTTPDHLTHAPARLGHVLLAPRAERRRRAGHTDGGGLGLVGHGPRCVRESVPAHEALPLADLVRARVRVRVRVRISQLRLGLALTLALALALALALPS